MTLEECQEKYGIITDGTWPNAAKFCGFYLIPEGINLTNMLGTKQVHVYGNKDILGPLDQAFKNVLERGLAQELHSYDGCQIVRDIRGIPGQVSCHAYGLAIDFNAKTNLLGGPSTMSTNLVQCFKDAGFLWGGDFTRHDPMHFTLGW